MLDVIILFLATAVGYYYLQLRGGQRFAPASSLKGRKERIVTWGLLGIIITATTSVFINQEASDRISTVAIPFIIGAMVFLMFYLKDKKRDK